LRPELCLPEYNNRLLYPDMKAKRMTRQGRRGPGQPRIDPESPLERRSVGLPVSWWKAVDALAEKTGLTASVIVRGAVGAELRRIGAIGRGNHSRPS
jgi:hypothetical protein